MGFYRVKWDLLNTDGSKAAFQILFALICIARLQIAYAFIAPNSLPSMRIIDGVAASEFKEKITDSAFLTTGSTEDTSFEGRGLQVSTTPTPTRGTNQAVPSNFVAVPGLKGVSCYLSTVERASLVR